MDFNKWEPVYSDILEDMGFSREEDERAALLLSRMLDPAKTADVSVLHELIEGRDVLVCGNAPGLRDGLLSVDVKRYVVIAADGAAAVVLDSGTVPDIIVTDLDGNVEREIDASRKGSVMVVHAHGDNTDKLERYVPFLNKVIGSTQSVPLCNVYNFGGFSDGDRCVFLAREFGAAGITLVGFDFDDENVTPIKKKKLRWARRLIGELLSE
ncbi:6-hydroxymethylpterin diphosphokinase MptE-like protein [Methanolobus chelungpuianus]|uniref:6-hydroxymethyl-7,8-dihydropterin pyrophosphokinase n=1 Tax=Methanolobus chelungpuianus TaxID=502115 RepID=A0AAE3L2A7_9EURY|nr:6-hydroxymethylpterin diphosphokinase MptE-like protein [Methanolobus chelungpuianus]MCQ6963488.1 hypothetical protein [Methanolobus chelungpuianus]